MHTIRTGPDYDEQVEVRRNRYQEAREAGLSVVDAHLFAESDQDIGTLRKLVAAHVEPELIARIVV